MESVRAGNTFVTVGPLVKLSVEGIAPGGKLTLPATGGSVDVEWQVESAMLPVEQVEIIVGGLAVEQLTLEGELTASGSASVPITDSTWIALRVRGSYRDIAGEIAAHSSAVQVLVEGKELFSDPDAMAVLEQIEGAIAYVDTIAPRPDAVRFKRLRATLESAYSRLHQRMHSQGLFHRQGEVAIAADARLVAQGLFHGTAQTDADVFDRVVLIDLQIAGRLDRQIPGGVLPQQGEHVVEEPDARVDLRLARAVERHLELHVGLGRFALDVGSSRHDFPILSSGRPHGSLAIIPWCQAASDKYRPAGRFPR